MTATTIPTRSGVFSADFISGFSKPKNTICLLGDSILRQDYPIATETTNFGAEAIGVWQWAAFMLGHRLVVSHSATDPWAGYLGVSGNTTTQMLARLDQVIALQPGYCLIMGGINDVTNAGTSATIVSNITMMVDKLIENGIVPIVCDLLPSGDINSTSEAVVWLEANSGIRRLASTTPGCIFCPISDVYLDSAATYPNATAGYTADNIHPNTKGAFKIGQRIYNVLNTLIPEVELFQNFYSSSATGAEKIVTNPTMIGTAGTLSTTTGVAATSWTASVGGGGSSVGSKVARTDTMAAVWQQLTYAGDAVYVSGAVDYTQLTLTSNVNIPAGLAVGDTLQVFSEFQVDASQTNMAGPRISIRFVGATNNPYYHGFQWETSAAYVNVGEDLPNGVIATPKVQIPTGTTSINVFIRNMPSAASAAFTTRHGRTFVLKY